MPPNKCPLTYVLINKSLIERNDKAACLEMCYQSSHPYVALAGLAGLTQIDQKCALCTSMRLAWCSDLKHFAWLAPVTIPLLSNNVDVAVFNNNMSSLMKLRPLDIHAVARLIDSIYSIHPALVVQWIDSQPHAEDLPSNLSLVVESYCVDLQSHGLKLPESILKILNSYKDIPGSPRVTYLEVFPFVDDTFKREFFEELNSDATSDDELLDLIRFRRTLAKEFFDKNSEHLSAHRAAFLKEALSRS